MSTSGDTISTSGDIMSTSGHSQYIEGYHDGCGGYHMHEYMSTSGDTYYEYIGVFNRR